MKTRRELTNELARLEGAPLFSELRKQIQVHDQLGASSALKWKEDSVRDIRQLRICHQPWKRDFSAARTQTSAASTSCKGSPTP